MNEPRDRPHPLELERWLLGEQAASERARTEQRLSAVEQAQLRREDDSLRAQLMRELPAEGFARRVLARVERRERSRAPGRLTLAAVLTLALVLLWLPPARNERVHEGASTAVTERAKGASLELRVYRRRGDRAELLHDGALASAGAVLQLGYLRAGYAHGVLLSIDGRGGVTLHHPRSTTDSSALGTKSGEQLLGEAYELDDAPDFERFVLVAGQEAIDVEAVEKAARELASDPVRARSGPLVLGFLNEQRSLLVDKSEPR
ncbi:MAG: ActD [Myxococcaceae bacterium]|nr:ActD [Myxococcaceae bacterium]